MFRLFNLIKNGLKFVYIVIVLHSFAIAPLLQGGSVDFSRLELVHYLLLIGLVVFLTEDKHFQDFVRETFSPKKKEES